MNTDLTKIRGVGPSTAEIFKKNGFQSIDDLASSSIANIAAIPGFQQARAEQMIASAKAALSEAGDDQPELEKPNKKTKAKKKRKDPKKSKSGKKKDKKKSKADKKKDKKKSKAIKKKDLKKSKGNKKKNKAKNGKK